MKTGAECEAAAAAQTAIATVVIVVLTFNACVEAHVAAAET